MIKGIGVDICDLRRLNHLDQLAKKILHVDEFSLYLSKDNDKAKREFVGGRFDAIVEKPGFEFGRDGAKARMSFFDNYNLTFELWLSKLVDTAPRSLRTDWSFYLVH